MPANPATDLPLDALATPIAWLAADGQVAGCNAAFAHWMGVGRRRLLGLPALALERDGSQLSDALVGTIDAPVRLRRVALAFPGSDSLRFADLWLGLSADGGYWLEVHPVDEFPGADPALLLPSAMSASLKGLAHELRNPLAGIKGAAQLLARRGDAEARELTGLIETEVGRLVALVDRLLSPAPPRAFEPVNIHAVLERVLRLSESDAGWAVRLQRDYDPSLP